MINNHKIFDTENYSFYMTYYNWGIYCVAWTVLNHSDVQSLESVDHLCNTALKNGIVFQ